MASPLISATRMLISEDFIYPYLRYGIVASDLTTEPGRLFNHNQALDLCLCCADLSDEDLRVHLGELLMVEVKCFRDLESINYDSGKARWFRSKLVFEDV